MLSTVCLLLARRPPWSPLFPYTTLFRSPVGTSARGAHDLTARAFGPGANGPLLVVVDDATAESTTRSEEHTSELQSRLHLVCRLLLEKKTEINVLSTAS